MSTNKSTDPRAPMTLQAAVARDVMMPNPVSISDHASVSEAIVFFTEKGFGAAPVIDDAGRPVGVVSRSDIVRHEREQPGGPTLAGDETEEMQVATGFQVERPDLTPVRDIMTPVLFSVAPDTPVREVVTQMLDRHIHHLFVVDNSGVLIGVISAMDVMRRLV